MEYAMIPARDWRGCILYTALSIVAASAVLIAFFCTQVSSPDYRPLLLIAATGVVIAISCAIPMFLRGGWIRWFAVAVGGVASFVAWDVLRRAPATFGWSGE